MKKAYKVLLISTGTISLLIGILGIFLPLLPTTPFLLLTAICYSNSSEKLHKRLLDSQLGHYITNYKNNKAIPKKVKIYVIIFLWLSIGSTILFLKGMIVLKIFLLIVAILVSFHIARLKTLKKFEY